MMLRLVVFAAILAAPLAASAQPEGEQNLSREDRARARQHFDAGVRAFESHDYHACVQEFELALAIAGHPSVLKNLGRCHEELGEVNTAIGYYDRYLNELPDAADRAQIEGRLADLRARQASQPPPPTTPPPAETAAPAPATAEVSTSSPGVLPWALVGGGLVGLGVGITLIALDGTCASDSPVDAEGDCAELRDTGLPGILLTAAGAIALGVGGYLLFAVEGDEEAAQAALRDPVIRF
jgi:tetratricopeptide (TPR) repeat protein